MSEAVLFALENKEVRSRMRSDFHAGAYHASAFERNTSMKNECRVLWIEIDIIMKCLISAVYTLVPGSFTTRLLSINIWLLSP
jgi:hypothetical protein